MNVLEIKALEPAQLGQRRDGAGPAPPEREIAAHPQLGQRMILRDQTEERLWRQE